MPQFPPEPFGRYILLNRIAVGGMAEVFRASLRGIGGFEKIVAIKRLHPNFSEDRQFIRMLLDEAKISAQLTHVNIAQIYDFGVVDDHYFIAMEFLEGKDLFQLLRKIYTDKVLIPLEAAVYIGMQICSGLYYAHNKRDRNGRPLTLIHRDISPQNILISYDGEVKIIDFGIAKAAERFTATESGVIKGKFYYMSPEQARGNPLDYRSDIFSAGLILYEILTSSLVYTDEENVTLLRRVQEATIPNPASVRHEITPMLDKIVMKALAENPDQRYQDALSMYRALADFMLTLPSNFGMHDLTRYIREMYKEDYQKAVKSDTALSQNEGDLKHFFQQRRSQTDGEVIPLNGNVDGFEQTQQSQRSPAKLKRVDKRRSLDGLEKVDVNADAATRIEHVDIQRAKAGTVITRDEWENGKSKQRTPERGASPPTRQPEKASAKTPKHKATTKRDSGSKSDRGTLRHPKHQRLLMMTLVGLSWIIIAFGVLIVVTVRESPRRPPSGPFDRTGSLLLRTAPRGASVYLKGEEQPSRTPMVLQNLMTEKPLTVVLRKQGFHDLTLIVTLKPGTTLEQNLTLKPLSDRPFARVPAKPKDQPKP